MQVETAGSPLVLVSGSDARKHLDLGASLCAQYSDLKHEPEVSVSISFETGDAVIRSRPAGEDIIERYRIR
jgi:NFACT protein RNA binding domain